MKAPTNDSELPIIALLFMLLLVYCSVFYTPKAEVPTDNSESVANNTTTENTIGTVKMLK